MQTDPGEIFARFDQALKQRAVPLFSAGADTASMMIGAGEGGKEKNGIARSAGSAEFLILVLSFELAGAGKSFWAATRREATPAPHIELRRTGLRATCR